MLWRSGRLSVFSRRKRGYFLRFNFQFLGTAAGLPTPERTVSALILQPVNRNYFILCDCGEGTQQQLMRSVYKHSKIEMILITHAHGDHCLGLPGLLMTWHVLGRKRPLHIFGPTAVADFLTSVRKTLSLNPLYDIRFTDIEKETGCELPDLSVSWFPLQHRVPSYAYRIASGDERDGAFIYAGDNGNAIALTSVIVPQDCLIHESTFSADIGTAMLEKTLHSSAASVAAFAETSGLKNLILTHFSQRYAGPKIQIIRDEVRRNFHGNCFIANDLDCFSYDSKSGILERQDADRNKKSTPAFFSVKELLAQGKGRSSVSILTAQLRKSGREYDGPILLYGETGSGKNHLARHIHDHSARKSGPFVVLNCASLNEDLLSREFFGSDSDGRPIKGKPEDAEGGTLYLDEIGEIPAAFQTKLLRFIETGRFRRPGSSRDSEVNVRIIASTQKDLREEMRRGRFRKDLLFRLENIVLTLPPLRERTAEIPALLGEFIEAFNAGYGTKIRGCSRETLDLLKAYSWPGNIRELRNSIERCAVLMNPDLLEPEHFSDEICGGAGKGTDFELEWGDGKSLEEVEEDLLRWALKLEDGNQSRAAARLGISRDRMRYKMKKYRLLQPK